MTTQAVAMTKSPEEMLASVLRPHAVEADYAIGHVEGEIPRDLSGTLYRNGPCQNILPSAGAAALHLFDGDALIHALRFENGTAHHLSRFARTESFLREKKEGTFCLGGLNLPADELLSEPPPGVQPNTNIVAHAGRLFALVENAMPFELDRKTLGSIGTWDYDGKAIGMSTTAHPKIDGRTGQMLIHGYQPIEPYVQLYVVEPDGSVSLAEAIDAPWPSMMHDFAITENYVIFPLGSVYFDLEAMLAGRGFGQSVTARDDLNMKFGIRRREPGSETKWFDAPSIGYMFHPSNAYEKDGRIVMDACKYEDPQGLLDDIGTIRAGEISSGLTSKPYLYEFDLEAGTCKETKLSDMAAEFPRLDDRLVGRENRFGYASTAEPIDGANGFFRRITKYDRVDGTSVHRETVPGQWVGEPVFVPRHADAAEDDGFVLNLVYDAPDDRTAVDILDARAIDAKPLARLWLEERVSLGFHGNFAPEA
ncbi:MAG: carotenoid oxygenase family protein [Candidatus Binatia bacterium]|nr:carotenoid oxygenase family protein [Candidatus Binatia bacterium]